MNLFTRFSNDCRAAIDKAFPAANLSEQLRERITVEPAKNPLHGDIATNAALVLSKALKMAPLQLAEIIATHLKELPYVAAVAVAAPGFINLTLTPALWQDHLKEILLKKESYGESTLGKGHSANVEFVSVNPTGPLHAGHGRNAVLGDAIASLLQKVGYKVVREYYINDAGGQVNALAHSVYLRYREALGETLSENDFTADMYPADYLIPVGQEIAKAHGPKWLRQPESIWLSYFRETAVAAMMTLIREDLAALNITMDVYTSEKTLVDADKVAAVLQHLQARGDIYEGVLTPPKGHVDSDWEERPQTLFRATAYGDDCDRALRKSDGSWTYFAGDIAYHYDKFQRGFKQLIDVLGADHAGYLKRLTAAVKALTDDQVGFEIKVCQMVNFLDNGQPVRMSKRAGVFVSVKEIVERVGVEATRFMMISRHQDMSIDFDFAKVIEQTKDNPIFYIQYAHARICSVMRHGAEVFPDLDFSSASMDVLCDASEIEVMRFLAQWPRLIEVAALVREPHRLTNYLYDLAALFHGLWNKGKENTHLRFIDPDNKEQTKARLAFLMAIRYVISSGLSVCGITPVQEMR